jgi:hypothetical protein
VTDDIRHGAGTENEDGLVLLEHVLRRRASRVATSTRAALLAAVILRERLDSWPNHEPAA